MVRSSKVLEGHEAIEFVRQFGGTLNKYTDPTEEALFGIDLDYAEEVACEDPSLVWAEIKVGQA